MALVAPAAAQHDLVLIGGQAVAFWQAQLQEYLPAAYRAVIASKDLDFQGQDANAVRATAALLGGEARIPRWDHHSPMIGLVAFKDAYGYERQLDILPSPHGLKSEQVSRDALPVELSPTVTVRVLHPIDCLASRLANSTLPSKQTERAWRQLDAAIQIVPAYGRRLLSIASGDRVRGAQRLVMNMNEAVFALAVKNRVARQVYAERGVDVSEAILADPRLPELHVNTRLPQMAQLLNQREAQRAPGVEPGRPSVDRSRAPERSDGYGLSL